MSRRVRLHLPGSTFHLTARTQGREPYFTPALRSSIVAMLREHVAGSDATLLAYAIMPNHLHLVVHQGEDPLAVLMQGLLRRIAIRVQRTHGAEGHVFERRFRDCACADGEYIRNAIVYTHLNPVRATLCADAREYSWSSHAAFLGEHLACDGQPHPVSADLALPLFASKRVRNAADLRQDYLAFLNWRVAIDRYRLECDAGNPQPVAPMGLPPLVEGDRHWRSCLLRRDETQRSTLSAPAALITTTGRADLRDVVLDVLRERDAEHHLSMVRSRFGGPLVVALRRAAIIRAAAAGYRGTQIAAYLRVSKQTVSQTLCEERRNRQRVCA